MSYASEVAADSPLLWLRFTETAGATCANSGSLGGDATALGTYTRNVVGLAEITPAITLGGATPDHVAYGDSPSLDITANVTLEAWIKCASFAAIKAIISKTQGGYCLRVNTSRQLEILKSNVAVLGTSSGLVPNDSSWHHVAVTRSSNTYTFYIDGAAAGTATSSTTIDATALNQHIGMDANSANVRANPLNGSIDEPAIYNTALSGARILAHYNAGTAAAASTFVPRVAAVY